MATSFARPVVARRAADGAIASAGSHAYRRSTLGYGRISHPSSYHP